MAALAQELESLHELEGEWETEGTPEGEAEWEGEISPVRKIYADGMMEHLAHMAAEAESEQEAAEHFLPLVGLAAKKLLPVVAKAAAPAMRKALPQVARAITRVEPQLTRGITRITQGLHRSPATRTLLHAMPSIARRTVHSIARQVVDGRPINALMAVRTLANQTRRVLSHPASRRLALRRSQLMDRRFHRTVAPGVARSHRPGGWGWRGYGPFYRGRVPTGAPGRPYLGTVDAGLGVGPVGGPGAGVCPPCPSCGGVGGAAAPAYCRCCGQLLR